jgi:hypothetical protein
MECANTYKFWHAHAHTRSGIRTRMKAWAAHAYAENYMENFSQIFENFMENFGKFWKILWKIF